MRSINGATSVVTRGSTTKAVGDAGEARALAHLQAQGLTLVQRNYRVARGPNARGGEVDLILRERDGTLVVPEKLTQQDIAERVGASRDMISRLFKDLVAGGYLSIKDRTITVLKKPPSGW